MKRGRWWVVDQNSSWVETEWIGPFPDIDTACLAMEMMGGKWFVLTEDGVALSGGAEALRAHKRKEHINDPERADDT